MRKIYLPHANTGNAIALPVTGTAKNYRLLRAFLLSALVLLEFSARAQTSPTITSVSPGSGNPGSSITITGTNFNTTPANNIVYFGATKAVVSSASATSLVATVPAGATYKPVTVNNTASSLTAYSQYPFLPEFNNSAYVAGTANLHSKVDFTAGSNTISVVIGDLDGDGKPDLVTANASSGTISVFRNTSASGSITAGSFATKVDFITSPGPINVALGDLDGDGKLDIVTANTSSANISVFRNTATSGAITSTSFAAKVEFTTGVNPNGMVISDLDGDGKPEIAVATYNSNKVSVFYNTTTSGSITTSSFAPAVDFTPGVGPIGMAIADIDGDGKSDLLVANYNAGSVSVFRNTSSTGSITSGSFAAKVDFTTGAGCSYIAIGDIDGDGKPDVIAANGNENTFSVLRNTATSGSITSGSFASAVSFTTGSLPQIIATGDIDGDGKPDIAVANGASNNVSVFRNTSSGGSLTFGPRADYNVGISPRGCAIGDMDGDGKPEVVASNQSSTSISVLRNDPFTPIAGLTSVCIGSFTTLSEAATGGTWSTGNSAVATVSSGGIVTGIAAGTAIISYTTAGGSVTSIMSVNGAPPITGGAQNIITTVATSIFSPVDVKTDAVNNLYITGNDARIYKRTPSGALSIVAGNASYTYSGDGGPATAASLNYAREVAIDGAGNLYIADQYNHRIRKVNTSGIITTIAGNGTADFTGDGAAATAAALNMPNGVAVDAAGNVYIADSYNGRIRKVNTSGMISTIAGGIGSGGLAEGIPATAASLGFPYYLEVDANNNIYVVDIGNNRIRKIDASGIINTVVGSATYGFSGDGGPATAATINGVYGMALGVNGAVYVSDYSNQRIRMINSAGIISTVAGNGASSFGGDGGPATAASFSGAYGVAVDGDGNIFLTNAFDNRVREVQANIITVCAGSTVTLANATSGGTWSSSNANATIGSAGILAGITAGTSIISYTVPGCRSTASVTVNALPTINAGSAVSICNGSSTTLTATGGVTYSWSPATALNSTTGASVTANPTVTTTYTLTGISASGCTGTATSVVTVVTPSITGNTSVCQGAAITLTGSPAGGSWTSSSTSVATVNSSGLVSGVAGGTVTITYTSPTACVTTTSITVNPLPDAGVITGTSDVHVGATITLSVTGTGGVWSSSNTSVAVAGSGGVTIGAGAGTAIISYTKTSGCGISVATANVTVTASGGAYCTSWGVTGAPDFSANGANYTNVAIGPDGTPYIAYQDGNSAKITVKKFNGSSWVTVGTEGFSPSLAFYDAIAIDASGTPYVAFADLANHFGATVMKFNGTSWVTVGSAGFSVGQSDYTGIAIDGSGIPYVVYSDQGIGGKAVVKKFIGGSWTTVGTAGFSAGTANSTNIALDPSGTPYVSFGDAINSGKATVYKYTGGDWALLGSGGISADQAAYTPIAIDGSGTPYIAYRDAANSYKITVMKYSGSSWLAVGGAGMSLGFADWPSIAIDGSGTPYVAYIDAFNASKTTVKKFNGASWVTVGNAGFSPGQANYSTIAIDGSGKPYVAYSDYTVAHSATVQQFNTVLVPEITGTTTVCAGSSTTLSNAATGGVWNSTVTEVATIGAATGIVAGITAGTSAISYTISGCSASAQVTVNPLPDAGVITGTAVVCAGATTALSNIATGGIWSSSNTSVAAISADGIVTGVIAGNATVSYSVTNSCGTAIATQDVTVNPLPDAGSITGTAVVCSGATTTLSSTSTGGVWSSSNTIVAAIGTDGIVTAANAGIATITYTVTNSCGTATATQDVTVNPLPDAGSVTGTSSVNTGSVITLSATASGGTWTTSNSNATVSAEGIVTGVTAGAVTISYTVTNSCGTAIATKAITVIFAITTDISGTLTVCTGSTTTLSNATTGGLWSSAGSTGIITIGASTGVVTGVGAGTATVTYTLSGSSVTAVVSVNQAPAAITGANNVCLNGTVTLSDATDGGTWSSSNTAIADINAATGMITGSAAGTVIMSYTSATGCYKTMSFTVKPLPAAISGASNVCEGAATTLTDATTGGVSWTSSNTAVATIGSSSGVMTGVTAGVATITYLVNTGCMITNDITVNTTPSAIAGTTSICTGASSGLSSSPAGGTWSSSNASYATIGSATGVITGVAAGTANITYSSAAGCRRIATVSINPMASAISGASSICVGSTAALAASPAGGTWSSFATDIATIGSTGIATGVAAGTATISYTLASGCASGTVVTVSTLAPITGTAATCTGSTTTLSIAATGGTWSSSSSAIATVGSGTGLVTGGTAGTATISYAVGAGCRSTVVLTVSAALPPITGTPSVCVNATTSLSNALSGGTWSSSNTALGTVDVSTGVVTGIAAGTITISYTVGTCYKTFTVTVKPLPAAIAGPSSVCIGSAVIVSDPTPGGMSWGSSTPAVATISGSGSVTGISAGTSVITFTLSTGCYMTTVMSVNPAPAPVTGSTIVCPGTTTTLSSATTGGTWSSSATGVATAGSTTGIITGVAAGVTQITYFANGCTKVTAVTVNPLPATITGTSTICTGTASALSTTTTGGTWSSSASTVASVGSTGVVTGVTTGTATISYTLATGCARSVVATVTAAPSITGSANLCIGNSAALGSTPSGGTWSSSTTSVATVGSATGIVNGLSVGTSNITYTLNAGCKVNTIVTVGTTVAAVSGAATSCLGSPTTFTDATSGGVWSSSNAAIATVDPGTGLVTGIVSGTAKISYTVSTGCYSTKNITVTGGPADITPTVLGLCTGATMTVSSASAPGTSWTSSNPSVATIGITSGIITGVSAGTTTITFTATTGCVSTKVATVDVAPSVAAISGGSAVAVGHSITLTDATPGGAWSASNTHLTVSGGAVTGVSVGAAYVSYTLTNGVCQLSVTRSITISATRPGMAETAATDLAAFNVYPNPNNGSFTVHASEAGIFTVYTLEGKEIQHYAVENGANALMLPKGLAAGVYMCRYNGDDGSVIAIRLVIEQ